MKFVLHSFFSVMLVALLAGLGIAYHAEYTYRARLGESAARPCEAGAVPARAECAASESRVDNRFGPLPPLVLPTINAVTINLADEPEPAAPVEPPPIRRGIVDAVPVDVTPAAITVEEGLAAAVQSSAEQAAAPIPAPNTPPPMVTPPTPLASPGGVTPQAKQPAERKAPVRPVRRQAERKPVTDDIVQPEFSQPFGRPPAAPRGAPPAPRQASPGPLLLPGAVETTNSIGTVETTDSEEE